MEAKRKVSVLRHLPSRIIQPPAFLKRALNHISARSRIVIGQVFLLVGVMMLAVALGIVPDERGAVTAGRARFCELIAVQCSTYVGRGDTDLLPDTLAPLVSRDKDILSAEIVKDDGSVVAQVGDHPAERLRAAKTGALEANMAVPIWANDERWGKVEVCFRPMNHSGFWWRLFSPQMRLVGFVCAICTALFWFYLRKVLQHLDPSKVVPPRVRGALDTLAEGLLVVDKEERVVLANQAFATITGKTPEALMGSRVSGLAWIDLPGNAPEDRPWVRCLRDGEPQRGVMIRLRDFQKTLRTFSVNCSPILGEEGKHRGVLVSLDDVTLLEQKEVELRKAKDTAESANQAKSEFLARMSHEIRTPMNAVLGFADVLRRGYEQNEEERHEYLETIHSSGQHLLELINDILDLSKIEAGKLEVELSRCSPHRLISEVISVLSVRAKQKEIGLEFAWDGPVPESIETDATRLRQVITNLIGNAIKFTEKGSVRLVAKLLPDEKLQMRIIDTGIGMKPDVLERIFTPFAQADTSITRRFGGTGLGLSISKQIAEALGDGVHVSSEYGKGSVFTVTIRTGSMKGVRLLNPAEIASLSEASAMERSAEPVVTLHDCRVLLVEDGASNRKLISLVLERAGAKVDWAEDGKIGVEMALAGAHDIVLMDMQMPVMDGYTAAAYLRTQKFEKPIIALTAHAMRGDAEKCLAAGCSGFLSKPIDMDLLVRSVADATGKGAAAPAAAVAKRPGNAVTKSAATDTRPTLTSSLPTEDPEFAEIVIEFVDRLHEQLGAIRSAWDQQDLTNLAALAHWVKGSGGTAGFDALTAPAKHLEIAARNHELDAISAAIAELTDLTRRIIAPDRPVTSQAATADSSNKT